MRMIEGWNKVVGPNDKVYHLGDVAMWKPDRLEIVKSLNGVKYLIRGNHDNYHHKVYTGVGFLDVVDYKEFKLPGGCFVCTHVPVHPMELGSGDNTRSNGRWLANVHGHIHQRVVRWPVPRGPEPDSFSLEPDPRYMCVSVEHTDYAPVELSVVQKRLTERLGLQHDVTSST